MPKLSWLLVALLVVIVLLATLNEVKFSFTSQLIDEKLYDDYSIKFNSFNNTIQGTEPMLNYSTNFKIIGATEYGYVTREGPFGNPNSPVKIAYLIGVHPMEWRAHLAVKQALNDKGASLNYCYYIYRVQVLTDADDYNNGRVNGQNLAYEFAIPDMKDKKFNLVIDVHSNRGDYQQQRFMAVLTNDPSSEKIAHQLVEKISWMVYYLPPPETGPTSGPFISKPLINSGIPTIVYETYTYDPFELTLQHAHDFVGAVDTLIL